MVFLRLMVCTLLFCSLAEAGDAPPDHTAQAQILDLMRQYATNYRMPDVAFEQILTHFGAPIGTENWKLEWTTEQQRIAHDGHQYLCCWERKKGKWRLIAGPPAEGHQYWAEGWSIPGHGEFPWDGAPATTTWNRWDTVRNHRVAVFDYSVSQQDSSWVATGFPNLARVPHDANGIPYSGPVTDIPYSVNVAYFGEIWLDSETGGVWRVSNVVTDLPARLKSRKSSTVIDYDSVTLGAATYLLPIAKTTVLDTNTERLRPEWVYRNYRKFEADSSITFFSADSTITYPRRP